MSRGSSLSAFLLSNKIKYQTRSSIFVWVNKIVGAQTLTAKAKMITFFLKCNIRKWSTCKMWSQKWRWCESLKQSFTYYTGVRENHLVSCFACIKSARCVLGASVSSLFQDVIHENISPINWPEGRTLPRSNKFGKFINFSNPTLCSWCPGTIILWVVLSSAPLAFYNCHSAQLPDFDFATHFSNKLLKFLVTNPSQVFFESSCRGIPNYFES